MTIIETAKQIKNENLSWFLLDVDSKILLRFGQFLQENGEIIQMPLFCQSSARKAIKYCEKKQKVDSMSVNELSSYFNISETKVRKKMVFFLAENDIEKYNPERIFEKKMVFVICYRPVEYVFRKRQASISNEILHGLFIQKNRAVFWIEHRACTTNLLSRINETFP